MATRYKEAVKLLAELYQLSTHASKDAFANGVTDSSGTYDEGDVRAGKLLGEVHEFLKEEGEPEDQPFEVGDLIFYLRDNLVCSAPVLSRQIVHVNKDVAPCTLSQEQLFRPFGPAGLRYSTCHGVILPKEAYATRNALCDALKDEPL